VREVRVAVEGNLRQVRLENNVFFYEASSVSGPRSIESLRLILDDGTHVTRTFF